jgi:rare lipoprotein A
VALVAAACTTNTRLAKHGAPGFRQSGFASWYGPGFDGKPTASGETYDMDALTAAHRQLPFGTVVEVRNRENGRTVVVRINDRGPFVRGRIIDLSRAAADRLELVRSGTAPVTLRVVEAARNTALAGSGWTVQAGAFRDRRHAERQLARVREVHREARLVTAGAWHRVLVGPFERKGRAQKAAAALRHNGIEALVRRGA